MLAFCVNVYLKSNDMHLFKAGMNHATNDDEEHVLMKAADAIKTPTVPDPYRPRDWGDILSLIQSA